MDESHQVFGCYIYILVAMQWANEDVCYMYIPYACYDFVGMVYVYIYIYIII